MFEVNDTSKYTGKGIFATEDIPEGTNIGLWISKNAEPGCRYLIEGEWFEINPIGRYANHSDNPNTEYLKEGDDVYLVSKGISEGDEILSNYWWAYNITGFKSSLLE